MFRRADGSEWHPDWKSLASVERYIHRLPKKLAPLVRAFFAGHAEARS